METVWISPDYESWFPGESGRTLDAIGERFEMDLATHLQRTRICQGTLTNDAGDPLDVYFKAYATRAGVLDGFCRLSRGVLEARNLRNFDSWGIPTPDVVAWGSRRRLAGICSDLSFIITRTVPGAEALRYVWMGLDTPASPEQRAGLIDRLARQVRTMHAHRFFHQDLKWRNLLIDDQDRLTWIDCPNGYFTRLRWRQRHGRVKDLATLDKIAKDRCTKEERLLFLRTYLNTDDETEVDRWAKAVAPYWNQSHAKMAANEPEDEHPV